MFDKSIFVGNQKLKITESQVKGEYVNFSGEDFYKISNFDNMPPFFMSIVSSSDHWMFISSNGGLTAGRKNPDNALFPYYTDDIIHDSSEITGNKTILKVYSDNKILLWEPFSNNFQNVYDIKRNLYKNIPGNKILFEEINSDLGLTFSYCWLNSEKYGFVKQSKIINNSNSTTEIEILDGIQNILPFGLYQQFQNEYSTLADGYKKNELLKETGIGIFSLSSIPSDKAEPSESLKSTNVWSIGLNVKRHLLSSRQLNDFRKGRIIVNESDIKAARGAYFINTEISIEANSEKDWIIIAEINQNANDLVNLITFIRNEKEPIKKVLEDVENGTKSLIRIVAKADGLQKTNDKLGTSRHFANVLFNTMRGGIFNDSYSIDTSDFISFVKETNRKVFYQFSGFLENLNPKMNLKDLLILVDNQNDSEFLKLTYEYLPLTFSRRHGDPSRPWNRFSIDIKDKENNKILNYEGNWRDIFQNWEALAESYPDFVESMITKFLNGSTADGYNPYRVTRIGFDWEIPEPEMPWSNIGYWGDHQIIYLLKLMEFSYKHDADKLKSLVNKNIFTYLNIPYRIKNYNQLLEDPHNTIDFDFNLNAKIEKYIENVGTDARSIIENDGTLYQVNLAEKLLAPLLSKLSNFIPGGGIWMNTQRPEWNDANNALVGFGVSMVTLYYTRRYVAFLQKFISSLEFENLVLSEPMKIFLEEINIVLVSNKSMLEAEITDVNRKIILDGVGEAGSKFRDTIYKNKFSSEKVEILRSTILNFLNISQKYLEQTIASNKREDGLYNAYNLMSVEDDKIRINYLYEMLEGQVAILSSGFLNTADSIELLSSLRNSKLYRKDQNSYILYPNRELSLFINKNNIPKKKINSSHLLRDLVEVGNTEIILKDVNGNFHFNGEIRNSVILKFKLHDLEKKGIIENLKIEENKILEIYESVFNHKYFTGRSGTFYKYEGLGSIYWHMVSKLLLATEETFYNALEEKASFEELEKLKSFYYEIKEGIGVNKSPDLYGAFPTDPYSHTPSFSGVQQPGMTGQVKEDIISRFGELGIIVKNGEINFYSELLNLNEFLEDNTTFTFFDIYDNQKEIKLEKNSIAFTYCQVPVIYSKSNENKITVYLNNNEKIEFSNLKLNREISRDVFQRNGKILKLEVKLNL